jgi:hypothetical protein
MMIQCPNCGFSGRIPNYAFAIPHHARCPECRHQFELGWELSGISVKKAAATVEAPSDKTNGRRSDDPSSSSYEIKAVTDDLGDSSSNGSAGYSWGDLQDDGQFEEIVQHWPVAARANASRRPESLEDEAVERSTTGRKPTRDATEPWHWRVLQGWGVFFLAWATLIAACSLYNTLFPVTPPGFRTELITAVISVLLLVPGAAGLFLLVDLARYIRGLSPTTPMPHEHRNLHPRTVWDSFRSWRPKPSPLQTARGSAGR